MGFLESKAGGIAVAVVIAMMLIGGAYYFATTSSPVANAASSDELLKEYAAKDSDNDGVPDWEEALYGTNPNNPDTLGKGIGDEKAIAQGLIPLKYKVSSPTDVTPSSTINALIPGQTAAPGTLTDQFAQTFFSNYLQTRGSTPPTADQAAQFIQGAIANMETARTRPDAFTRSDVDVTGGGSQALITYATNAQAAFQAHSPHLPQSELTYFEDATNKNDASAIANITAIANSYHDTAEALAAIPVPAEMAAAHLDLMNSVMRLSSTIADMASVQSDPVRGMLGLEAYKTDAPAFVKALQEEGSVFQASKVSVPANTPGSGLLQLIASASAPTTP